MAKKHLAELGNIEMETMPLLDPSKGHQVTEPQPYEFTS